MFNSNQIHNILTTAGVSLKPVNRYKTNDGKSTQAIVIFDDASGKPVKEFEGDNCGDDALKWIITNRNGVADIISDDDKDKQRIAELEAKLAATSERIDAIVAASTPVSDDGAEAPKPRRGRRAAEPSPETADQNAD